MSSNQQKVTVNLVPFQREQISTNQQRIPIPYLGGERVIAARWMTRLLDKRTKQADSMSKKG